MSGRLQVFGNASQFIGATKFGTPPDYSEFEDDGTLVAYGNATCWLDDNFDPIIGRGASAPDLINLDDTSIQIAGFDGVNTLEQVSAHREIQHNYAQGTNMVFHVHWMPVNANAGNVEWFLDVYIRGGATVYVNTTLSVLSAAPGVAWQEQRVDIGTVTGTNLTIGMQVGLRLYRDPGVGNPDDTYASDAAVATFGYHYQANMLGSREVAVK